MKMIVACEYSGVVRETFKRYGWYSISCDELNTEIPGNHYRGDIIKFLESNKDFNLLIGHPPCTHLAISGARHFKYKEEAQKNAIKFFLKLFNCGIPHIALENPVGVLSTKFRKPDQYIQPYHFGYPYTKKTGLWLKNLPLLKATKIILPPYISIAHIQNGWKDRSRTLYNIADAMAEQWTEYFIKYVF